MTVEFTIIAGLVSFTISISASIFDSEGVAPGGKSHSSESPLLLKSSSAVVHPTLSGLIGFETFIIIVTLPDAYASSHALISCSISAGQLNSPQLSFAVSS